MDSIGDWFAAAASSFQRLLSEVGIIELSSPDPERRKKRARGEVVEIDSDIDDMSSQRRHKSHPPNVSRPRPHNATNGYLPSSTHHKRSSSVSSSPFYFNERDSVIIEAVSFQSVYVSPTRVRASLSRIRLSPSPSSSTISAGHRSPSPKRRTENETQIFGNSEASNSSSPPPTHQLATRSPPNRASSPLPNQFRSFKDVFAQVERERAKTIQSPLISRSTSRRTAESAPSKNSQSNGTLSNQSASSSSQKGPQNEISADFPKMASSKKFPERQKFDYFSLPKRTPEWIVTKQMYDDNASRLKHAEENAKQLRALAEKEKESQRRAYEEYRTPPVSVKRKQVEMPCNVDEANALDEKVRFGDPTEDLVVQKGGEQVSRRDLSFLLDQEWLNDVCINAYLYLIRNRSTSAIENKKIDWPKTWVFGSFLLDQLCNGKNGYNYEAVRRSTLRAKVDIFSFDKILVPFHLGNHWTMACINIKLKRFEYYDSLGNSNAACIAALKRYLNDEWNNKKNATTGYDTSKWTVFVPKNIPYQSNGYDCGVFALTYANYLSRGKPFDFTQADMETLRFKILYQIVKNEPLELSDD